MGEDAHTRLADDFEAGKPAAIKEMKRRDKEHKNLKLFKIF